MPEKIRTTLQPTQLLEVSDSEHAALKHAGLLYTGTDEELAKHYQAAGLELPADLKPSPAKPGAEPAKTGTTITTEQPKGA